jgi:hypothetical protein
MTKELRGLIVPEVPPGYVAMPQAMRILGVSRQTIMQRVKRGELSVVHVSRGRQKRGPPLGADGGRNSGVAGAVVRDWTLWFRRAMTGKPMVPVCPCRSVVPRFSADSLVKFRRL